LWTTMLLRMVQGRSMLHRLGTRTVVIGDVPWVSQSLEAFTSKLFASAYSIASVNVYSGNPADHLVHRFTHRVTRGTLLAVGRPDGRLSALTSAENAVCLSVNQASSIQSLGARCESLTVGHNPFKLPLSHTALFLPGKRPRFVCEQALYNSVQHLSAVEDKNSPAKPNTAGAAGKMRATNSAEGDEGGSVSSSVLLGRYVTLKKQQNQRAEQAHTLMEVDNEGSHHSVASRVSQGSGRAGVGRMSLTQVLARMRERRQSSGGPHNQYLGQELSHAFPSLPLSELMDHQQILQHLYEARLASMQRLVAFQVLFHALAQSVASFWPAASLGLLRYQPHRTQSIMRVATTASPVSGMDVRERMLEIAKLHQVELALQIINKAVSKLGLEGSFHSHNHFAGHHSLHVLGEEEGVGENGEREGAEGGGGGEAEGDDQEQSGQQGTSLGGSKRESNMLGSASERSRVARMRGSLSGEFDTDGRSVVSPRGTQHGRDGSVREGSLYQGNFIDLEALLLGQLNSHSFDNFSLLEEMAANDQDEMLPYGLIGDTSHQQQDASYHSLSGGHAEGDTFEGSRHDNTSVNLILNSAMRLLADHGSVLIEEVDQEQEMVDEFVLFTEDLSSQVEEHLS